MYDSARDHQTAKIFFPFPTDKETAWRGTQSNNFYVSLHVIQAAELTHCFKHSAANETHWSNYKC
jgi:hypothetical protein